MIRIEIKKDSLLTHAMEFSSIEEGQEWLARHEAMKTFGKPEHIESVLVTPEIPAITELREVKDDQGNSFEPPQFADFVIVDSIPAVYIDQVIPSEYEVIQEDITLENAKQILVADKRTKGRKAAADCNAVLELIGGFNIDRELTFAQKNEMKILFANAKSALNDFQPSYAKYFILQITADEILLTQEMKDLCLELLQEWEIP